MKLCASFAGGDFLGNCDISAKISDPVLYPPADVEDVMLFKLCSSLARAAVLDDWESSAPISDRDLYLPVEDVTLFKVCSLFALRNCDDFFRTARRTGLLGVRRGLLMAIDSPLLTATGSADRDEAPAWLMSFE